MGKFEIEQFLTHLVTQRSVSASTQNQAYYIYLKFTRQLYWI